MGSLLISSKTTSSLRFPDTLIFVQTIPCFLFSLKTTVVWYFLHSALASFKKPLTTDFYHFKIISVSKARFTLRAIRTKRRAGDTSTVSQALKH